MTNYLFYTDDNDTLVIQSTEKTLTLIKFKLMYKKLQNNGVLTVAIISCEFCFKFPSFTSITFDFIFEYERAYMTLLSYHRM